MSIKSFKLLILISVLFAFLFLLPACASKSVTVEGTLYKVKTLYGQGRTIRNDASDDTIIRLETWKIITENGQSYEFTLDRFTIVNDFPYYENGNYFGSGKDIKDQEVHVTVTMVINQTTQTKKGIADVITFKVP